jgi:two-component system, cell cycle sensor histidine kinase and response regulator CckA
MTKLENTPGETILLVEDEPAVRALVALTLSRAGYNVLQAGNGETALAVFDEHAGRVDLLVTDVRMPQMDGAELVRQLRSRTPDLKVLCISGFPGSGSDITVTEHYLAKPFSKVDLLDKVRYVLDTDL